MTCRNANSSTKNDWQEMPPRGNANPILEMPFNFWNAILRESLPNSKKNAATFENAIPFGNAIPFENAATFEMPFRLKSARQTWQQNIWNAILPTRHANSFVNYANPLQKSRFNFRR